MKEFPNGFDSWVETNFEVVDFIMTELNHSENTEHSRVHKVQSGYGRGGLYELAEEWTDAFERKNKDREWDGEFFDEIDEFLTVENRKV
jgi:hypothetical protein